MKTTMIAAATAVMLATLTNGAFAAPAVKMADPNQKIPVGELIDRMGQFDANDAADMAAADTVMFYHVPDAYEFDDYSQACSAMDTASSTALHDALAKNPTVAKLFEDNGYNPNDVVAVVHNPGQNSFAVYLR